MHKDKNKFATTVRFNKKQADFIARVLKEETIKFNKKIRKDKPSESSIIAYIVSVTMEGMKRVEKLKGK